MFLSSLHSLVLNNFIRFILTAAHCVLECTKCNRGRSVAERDKKDNIIGYRIKAQIGRFKNHDTYNITKVIQHPEFQEGSAKQVVKYCNKALRSAQDFQSIRSHTHVHFLC